jgi:hypothetical protein
MKRWVRSGLVWAGILYVITMVLFPLFDHENFSWGKLLLGMPVWIVTGLALGFLFDKEAKKAKPGKKARR